MVWFRQFIALVLKCFCTGRTEGAARNKENNHPSQKQELSVAFAAIFSKRSIFFFCQFMVCSNCLLNTMETVCFTHFLNSEILKLFH